MLVRLARTLSDSVHVGEPEATIFDLLDELVLKAFKVVERAVRFHDIWSEGAEEMEYSSSNRPLTPPVDASAQAQASFGAEQGDAMEVQTEPALVRHTSPPMPTPPENREDPTPANPPENHHTSGPISQEPVAPPQPASLLSTSAKRSSVSHRLSYVGAGSGTQRHNLASERLSSAHDSFLGFLGTFIGLHFNSRSSHELAATTHQSVLACQQLIAVVEEIWARDGRRQDALQSARDVMYSKLAELVQTAKDMLITAQSGDDVLNPDQGKQLVVTTTNCILAAGDCVAKARQTIERIGDFELESETAGLADQIFQALSYTTEAPKPVEEVVQPVIPVTKPLPLAPTHAPIEPRAKPPPPPPLTLNIETKPLPEPPRLSPIVVSDSDLGGILAEPLPPNGNAQHFSSGHSSRSSGSSITAQSSIFSPTATRDANRVSLQSPATTSTEFSTIPRGDISVSTAETNSMWENSVQGASTTSLTSTVATTPERSPARQRDMAMSHAGSVTDFPQAMSEETMVEEQVMETTYAHELIPSKDGQVLGGSLAALIERLTTHDSTPDNTFVTTFYLTFRLFTTPVEFARGLVDRFDYIGGSQRVGVPVRLRIHNVFKGWLETHWQPENDTDVLPIITEFANFKLAPVFPSAASRLNELIMKVSERGDRAIVPRLVSALGKTSTSVTAFSSADSNIPTPNMSKSQLNSLRQARVGGSPCSILDFDALELARQFTIIESRIFCSIGPEELLALEWQKKTDCRAVNVKAMSTLSTDLANLVADTILQFEEPKKRATMIKQWVKIAMKCMDLNNYDSLMAIICSLNSSMVTRLKRTWELVSQKTKTRLADLGAVVEVGKNYAVLRDRLKNLVAPCIPFVGLYLTDLTFVDAGNPMTRELPTVEPRRMVINFDRYVKIAKTITQLQRFQVPYRLAAVPELQEWIESQITRIRESETANVQAYYRRSLQLEPREGAPQEKRAHWYSSAPAPPPLPPLPVQQPLMDDHSSHHSGHASKESVSTTQSKERFDFFSGSFSGTSFI
jgi:hypothetical protein